ncbi:hypothetical protein FGG08_003642 [Glutinoglossum americanum]|uniref:Nucleolar protein 12 n=1 Tax=Glutinoglossum americanum TaxID=1670608 RepID=A0A9P8I980_9PEZI|nr:hypothetical protein FGG08_003642 [Glutinoglossum americanum]
MAPPTKRRKNGTVEVVFDPSARVEYLTGFHKRKLQRIKHAREEAAKREKSERATERKRLRELRKEELKSHVEAVNALLRQQVDRDKSDNSGGEEDDDDEQEWAGLGDLGDDKPAPIDHEDEYIDEDRYTTVTIESIDITKSGLYNSTLADSGPEERGSVSIDAATTKEKGISAGKRADGRLLSTKEKPSTKPKAKKKFRYLSKGDRKVARMKERLGNKAKAKARRE